MIAIILEIYFIEILFKRRYRDQNSEVWKTKLISLDEFILLVTEACFFIRVKPPTEDLKEIFIILDTNKDGFISFQ
jgi:Ca2+-binding EF-hand superfamily protein